MRDLWDAPLIRGSRTANEANQNACLRELAAERGETEQFSERGTVRGVQFEVKGVWHT